MEQQQKQRVGRPKGKATYPYGQSKHYFSIHHFLNRNFPKSGVCEACGRENADTDWAFLYHPLPHTRNREDYWEVCHGGCHRRFDLALPQFMEAAL